MFSMCSKCDYVVVFHCYLWYLVNIFTRWILLTWMWQSILRKNYSTWFEVQYIYINERERECPFFNEFSDLCFCESYCSKISDRNFQYAQNGVHLNYYYLSSFQWFSDTVFVTLLKKGSSSAQYFPKNRPHFALHATSAKFTCGREKKNCWSWLFWW